MKKNYIAPSLEAITIVEKQLIAASGLQTTQRQETEVIDSWSRQLLGDFEPDYVNELMSNVINE